MTCNRPKTLAPKESESARSHKLIVFNGQSKLKVAIPLRGGAHKRKTISQKQLARLQQLQSDVDYNHHQLKHSRKLLQQASKQVRRNLVANAKIQKGPLRAWLEEFHYVDGKRKSKTRTKLLIR